ncbi:AraC family transcriptional regulator [Ramlibacter sp. WS9]|uniref:AraC family transcriptional regulator n=1 Tax=Ramlibacter sp. WS9 TaxID=1882741 RepID=UPI001144653F|nr:AraC family transcriptional regulator [Ramlibacter sp. WS9]ROZ75029.1 AraC family transcriptional regulator [Ramlibacter sp. WS9]
MKTEEIGLSYQEVLRSIDMSRLKRLAEEAPGDDPARTIRSMVTADSKALGYSDLLVWEQHAVTHEYYVPPNNRYDIFIRYSATSPVVQWREGVLDVRQHSAGQVVIAPPYQPLYFRTFGPGHNVHLSITPALLMKATGHDCPNAAIRLRNCFGEADGVINSMGRALLEYVKAPGARPRDFLEPAGMALAVRLLERFGEAGETPRGKLSALQLARIDEYITDQLDSPVSLSAMAQLLDLSPHAFYRAFKATLGLAPLRYSLQLRMRRARDLVEGTTKPIGEIGTVVGFPDLAHFSNTFRKYWGLPPTHLRRH